MQIVLTTVASIFTGIGAWQALSWFRNRNKRAETTTRQMPEIDEGIEIPEQDQEYLAPIVVKLLKHLAATKKAYPTNSMLIEHLSEALSEASGSFKRRTKNDLDTQKNNEQWMYVAALAIRLYDEGTPHNSDQTREQFMTTGVLAGRELDKWAMQVNAEIADMVKRKMGAKVKGVEQIKQHAETVGGSPYTTDEMKDLMDSHMRILDKAGK